MARKLTHWTIRLVAVLALVALFSGSFDVLLYTGNIALERLAYLTDTGRLLNADADLRHAYDVIVSAYMNSGSTFTGKVLGHRKDAFYFYEPLWRLNLWGYFHGNFSVCSTRSPECRTQTGRDVNSNKPIPGSGIDFEVLHNLNATNRTPALTVPLKALEHIYACRLREVRNLIQPGVTSEIRFAGPSWRYYSYCAKKNKQRDTCLQAMEDGECKTARHIVTKVIRLSVGCYGNMLENNPKLKVVHLFRDPRAIIHSRIKTFGYPIGDSGSTSYEVTLNVKALCKKMSTDLTDGLKLMARFPGRFRFIHYEDIAVRDNAIIALHNYLGMTITETDLNRIRSSSSEIGRVMDYNELKKRRENNAFWWRHYLDYNVIKTVNKICTDVLTDLGYEIFNEDGSLGAFNQTALIKRLRFSL